jgi:hypothetical protein
MQLLIMQLSPTSCHFITDVTKTKFMQNSLLTVIVRQYHCKPDQLQEPTALQSINNTPIRTMFENTKHVYSAMFEESDEMTRYKLNVPTVK